MSNSEYQLFSTETGNLLPISWQVVSKMPESFSKKSPCPRIADGIGSLHSDPSFKLG